MYDTKLARWLVQDPLAEKYYSFSAYNYCVNNPVSSIDVEGKLVIFINGFGPKVSDLGKASYWNGFDVKVMNRLGDYNSKYLDGSNGGPLIGSLIYNTGSGGETIESAEFSQGRIEEGSHTCRQPQTATSSTARRTKQQATLNLKIPCIV